MTNELPLIAIIIGLAFIMFKKSKIFRYYAKYLFFLIFTMITSTISIPVMLLKPRDYRNALFPAWGCRQASRILGVKWRIQGQKNILQDEGTIVLINHQSFVDLIVLAEIWPVLERCTVISKREIFYLWPFGLAAWLWGTVFINRSNKKDAQAAVNLVAHTINTKKAKICMFPEGTRHGGPTLRPFKKGAFHIAINSQAAIQPIVVNRYKFLDHKTFQFDEGSNVISILPVIPTAGLKPEDIDSLMEKTYAAMSKEYEILNKEA